MNIAGALRSCARGIRRHVRSAVKIAGGLLACTLAAATLAAAATPAREIRLFAIGYRHLAADADSYASYRAHLAGLASAADPNAELDDDLRPKVFLFPEDSALFGLFTGIRGVPFRALEPVLAQGGGNGSSVAIAGLFAAYQLPAAYYRLKFPAANFSEARLGLLALTDTIYRSFYETFRAIAVEHHAWVIAAANVAAADVTRDPAAVALLADPEALAQPCIGADGEMIAPPCAYEATTANVYNQAFVFDPSGALVRSPFADAREGPLDGAVKKTYLVPEEQGPLEAGKIGLDLAYGSVRQVRPIDIAGVRMGILISKPAWMMDELDRLEAYDAEILLQPEAFSGFGSPVDDWQPDVLKQANWSALQKHAPFRFGALAELTGKFFDLVFDAQDHIATKATTKPPPEGPPPGPRYIGQPDDVGWVAVSPWIVGDASGEPCAAPMLLARRECLAAAAEAAARDNGYVERFVTAVLRLAPPLVDETRAPGILGANVRVDDAPVGARARNAKIALAADGSSYVVWQDDRSGVDQIRVARISAHGSVGRSTGVAPQPGVRQIFPQVAVTGNAQPWFVWQTLDPSPRVEIARFGGPATPLDLSSEEQWKPAIATGDDGALHVVWIGLVGGRERLFYAHVVPTSGGFESETKMLDDDAMPASLAERLNNRWSPAIAVSGDTVAVAWSDFRNYAWEIFAAVSRDGGKSFSPSLRIDDAPDSLERLHADPSIEVAGDGTVRVAWTDQAGRRAGCASCASQRRPDADIAFAALGPGAEAFQANVRVDDTGDGLTTADRIGFSNQWRPAITQSPSHLATLVAAWQDHREGNDDIYLATSHDGGDSWSASHRVDDTGAGPSNQSSPAVTLSRNGVATVVWQDDRDGVAHVYMARGTLPRH
jgi:hypothetical protein